MFNGMGQLTQKDGRYYIGTFKDNLKDGMGSEVWPNGKKYNGQY